MVAARRQDPPVGGRRAAAVSRSLYLIGAPGSGKSTVMRHVVAGLGLRWAPDIKVYRELWVNPLLDEDGVQRGLSLGKERGAFSGTDALSMSVLPRALEWLRETELPEYVLGEGARLSSPKFLVELDRHAPLTVGVLAARWETLVTRRAEREGDTLTDRFVAQASTRATNAALAMRAFGYPVTYIDTEEYSPEQVARKLLLEMG